MRTAGILIAWSLTFAYLTAQGDPTPISGIVDRENRRLMPAASTPLRVVQHRLTLRPEFNNCWRIESSYRLHNPTDQPVQTRFAVPLEGGAFYAEPPVLLDGRAVEWLHLNRFHAWRALAQALQGMQLASNLSPQSAALETYEKQCAEWASQRRFLNAALNTLTPPYKAFKSPPSGWRNIEYEWLIFTVSVPARSERTLTLRYQFVTERAQTYTDAEELWLAPVHLVYVRATERLAFDAPTQVRVILPRPWTLRSHPPLQARGVRNDERVYEGALRAAQQLALVAGTPRDLRKIGVVGDALPPTSVVDWEAEVLNGAPYVATEWFASIGGAGAPRAQLRLLRDGAEIKYANHTLRLVDGSRRALWNGNPVPLTAPPLRVDGRVYLHLRDFAFWIWQLGGEALWGDYPRRIEQITVRLHPDKTHYEVNWKR